MIRRCAHIKIKSWQRQAGYLTLVTVVLIVIVGFIAVALAYIIFGSAFGNVNLQQATSALYLAESGLEDATHALLAPILTNRLTCSGLSLNNSIGSGAYGVTGTGPFSASTPTALSAAVTATATTVPVTSTSSYQSSGRIMIDREFINYSAVNGAHFVGVTRGVDGSTAASHASGALVGQYQCNLSSQGGVPNLSPGMVGGKRLLTEVIQLQEGWAVGNNITGPAWNVAHWNKPTEKTWTQQAPAISSPQNLNGVSMVSNVDVWLVGNKATALHFNGSTWSNINSGVPGGDNLLSVSAISSHEVWASSSQGRIYKWSGGASWATSASPGNTLKSISMLDINGVGTASTGWVVGAKKTAFIYVAGSGWSSANTGITQDLNGVSTLSATDAWAAGNAGTIFHWNGSNWTADSTPSSTPTLKDIDMIQSGSTDMGWAVGTSSTAWYFNGTSWVSQNTGLAAGLTLNSVLTVSANEAWAVDASGHIYEWNKSTWTLVDTASAALNSIDLVHPNSQPFAAWGENFS